jgi:hypothetical protein
MLKPSAIKPSIHHPSSHQAIHPSQFFHQLTIMHVSVSAILLQRLPPPRYRPPLAFAVSFATITSSTPQQQQAF